MKARISFDINLPDFRGIEDEESLRAAIVGLVIEPARKAALTKLHEARRMDAPQADKAVAMSLPLMAMTLTMALEAGISVEITEPV